MYKIFRIICTILAAICAGAVIPVGAFLGTTWALILGGSAFVLYLIMMFFKQAQETKEANEEANPPSKAKPCKMEDEETTPPAENENDSESKTP